MKIKIILPFGVHFLDAITEETAKKYASPGTEIACIHPEQVPDSIENQYDEAFAVPGVLEEVENAEKEGFDGVLISCFGDPGLKPARELTGIPVIGTAEAGMLFATALAQRFSVVTILSNIVPLIFDLARTLGVHEKVASVRDIGVCVASIKGARESGEDVERICEEAIKAIDDDGAQAIVLGGTCMTAVAPSVHDMLIEKRGYNVPIIDPVGAPVKFLESLIALGLAQSKLTYMSPPAEPKIHLRSKAS